MVTAEFLVRERDVIVREAEETLMHLRERHYESAGAAEVERRLGRTFRPSRRSRHDARPRAGRRVRAGDRG